MHWIVEITTDTQDVEDDRIKTADAPIENDVPNDDTNMNITQRTAEITEYEMG